MKLFDQIKFSSFRRHFFSFFHLLFLFNSFLCTTGALLDIEFTSESLSSDERKIESKMQRKFLFLLLLFIKVSVNHARKSSRWCILAMLPISCLYWICMHLTVVVLWDFDGIFIWQNDTNILEITYDLIST